MPRRYYELWSFASGNLLGTWETLDEVREVVRDYARLNGKESLADIGVLDSEAEEEDNPNGPRLSVELDLLSLLPMSDKELEAEVEAAKAEFGSGEGLAIAFDLGLCYFCKHREHGALICWECGCTDKKPVYNLEIPDES